MDNEVSIIIDNPEIKNNNSKSIVDYISKKLLEKKQNCCNCFLNDEPAAIDNLMERINRSDLIIIVLSVYQNSVPSSILKCLEEILNNKRKLQMKERKLFVIANSSFLDVSANKCALICCRLFARDMGFNWLGGISVSASTLLYGKKVDASNVTYKRLIQSLNIITECISKGEEIPEKAFMLAKKSFMLPCIYKFDRIFTVNPVIKKVSKYKYYARLFAYS